MQGLQHLCGASGLDNQGPTTPAHTRSLAIALQSLFKIEDQTEVYAYHGSSLHNHCIRWLYSYIAAYMQELAV